ncbi:MAG: 1-acyl-sn-glycerol-3-phosphate acyltransferase [Deltaproteobacteria bacterium]|nr:1-acyl-sn-glycerol-3-phosphate acyltransferase [Deltaproteobacteria bacterium]
MAKQQISNHRTIRQKIRQWIDTTLGNTHNHYICLMPERTGSFSSLVLKLFFSGIKIDEDQYSVLRKIPENAIVVYVNQYRSYFEYLFYYTRYKQAGVRFPAIGFGYKVIIWQPVKRLFKIILAFTDYLLHEKVFPNPYESGYIKDELVNGRSALLSLVEKKGFYKRFVKAKYDPVHYLIEMQSSINRPIYLVPQLIFFSKKPPKSHPTFLDILFGTKEKPGKIRRLAAMLNNKNRPFVEISEPVNLNSFIKLTENKELSIDQRAILLRRQLMRQINRHRHSITGPVQKSKQEIKENILTGERLQGFMKQYAAKHKQKIWDVHKQADSHIEEIAARYNSNLVGLFAIVVRWILRFMFDGVTVNYEMLARIKAASQKGPLIFIPCHKSHIDYLILSYIMLKKNMPGPHIAAGKNLSFWPLGPLFRIGGAFFIRRSFKGAVLYSKIFTEYIYKLLEEGFNLELFIEGGRSRTGKLLRPQLGLLSIIINACKNGACKDLNLVPVYIGYDRVLEESAYINEIEGGSKEDENIKQVIKARRFLKKRYGKIYIKFSEAVTLKEFVNENDMPLGTMTSKEQNALCRKIGTWLLHSIDKVTVVTPHALVASAILNCTKNLFSYDHLLSIVDTYIRYLSLQEATLADTLLLDQTHVIDQVVDSYMQRKFIETVSKGEKTLSAESQFKVNENKRSAMEYYKNNCIAFFIPAAFTALAILEKDAFQFSSVDLHSGYKFFQEFFKNEFTPDPLKTPENHVRKNIKAFIDDAILMPHPTLSDTYNITSSGLRKLKLYSGFLKAYFESYWVALAYFNRYPNNSVKAKDRLKKIQSLGNRMYKKKEIKLHEAVSRVNFQNASDYFIQHGIRGSNDQEKIDFYSEKIQNYMNYLS